MQIRAYSLYLVIPIICLLTGCSHSDLQQDPRTGKFASQMDAKYDDAVKVLDGELAKNPGNLSAEYARATVEVESGNLQNGLDRLDKLLQHYPTYSFGYSERSRANFKAQRFEQAVSDADMAIRYRPDVVRNYIRRAVAYLSLHQPDKALKDLSTATKMDPKEDPVFVGLLTGLSLMELRRYQEALPFLSDSVAHAGNDDRPYINRGVCYAHLKEWNNAMADSEKAMKLRPDDVSAKVLHAALLSATGHRRQARESLVAAMKTASDMKAIVQAADLGPDVPSVADVALACIDAGKAPSADKILTLVEARRPLEGEELLALAKMDLAQGDLFRAAKLLNQCVASQPTWVEPRVELIKLYIRDNLPQKARDVQREGLELPLSPEDRKTVASAIR